MVKGCYLIQRFSVRWRSRERCRRKIGTGLSIFFFLLYSFQKKQTKNIGPVPFGAEPLFQIPPWLHCMHTEANVPAQGFHQRFLNLRHTTTSLASNHFSTLPLQPRHEVELEYANHEPVRPDTSSSRFGEATLGRLSTWNPRRRRLLPE